MPRCGLDQDDHMQQVKYYVKTGRYHTDTQLNQKNGIRKIAHCFQIKDDVMFYYGKDVTFGREVIIGDEKRKVLLAKYHVDEEGHHRGQKSMRDVINRHYYWQTIVKDIKEYINLCTLCIEERKLKYLKSEVSPTSRKKPAYHDEESEKMNLSPFWDTQILMECVEMEPEDTDKDGESANSVLPGRTICTKEEKYFPNPKNAKRRKSSDYNMLANICRHLLLNCNFTSPPQGEISEPSFLSDALQMALSRNLLEMDDDISKSCDTKTNTMMRILRTIKPSHENLRPTVSTYVKKIRGSAQYAKEPS